MVVMALDHVRDYFHFSAFFFSPADPDFTTPAIFFTRWITNFCAPGFCLLSGVSAYISGFKKSKKELSFFLWTRGLWLIVMELTVINFSWTFDPTFHNLLFLVIWSLGVSMVCLSFLIFLNPRIILGIRLIMIFGHNAFDQLEPLKTIFWAFIHEGGTFDLGRFNLIIGYPVVPWIGVMSFGYCIGPVFKWEVQKRKILFLISGLSACVLFVLLRAINLYGDPNPWKSWTSLSQTIFHFFGPNKYPPSLLFLYMTLGPIFLFLYFSENWKGSLVNRISIFGKVPFFFYLIHIYVIHFFSLVALQLQGLSWNKMFNSTWSFDDFQGFGFGLFWVYMVWIGLIFLLYPFCKWYEKYKSANKQCWWLSYL